MSANNSTDIIVKGSIFQEREEEDYPDPTTLPLPSQEPRITEEVTLSELIPGKYISTNIIVHIKEQSGTSTVPSFKAILLKHQYIKTPKSAILYIKKTGGMVLLD